MIDGIANNIRLPKDNVQHIIKVIGVGGGGSNAVNHMYKQGIENVSFMVCNTDDQALCESPVQSRVLLGYDITQGLGAGNKPQVARQAAEASIEDIKRRLSDGTRMVFITAGMGGGTGTGAAPIIAREAQNLNLLTIGIVTIPFQFEGRVKIIQALQGVAEMSQYVDALLVIQNEKLSSIYSDLVLSNAFAKADDILSTAAKGISEIITKKGYINVDFNDVSTIMRNGGVAVMNTGEGEGDKRITSAIEDALYSPLLNNNDIHKSKKILLNFYTSKENEMKMQEIKEVNDFMDKMGPDVEVIWGATYEEGLGDKVRITLLATSSNMNIVPSELRGEINNNDIIGKKNKKTATKITAPKKAAPIQHPVIEPTHKPNYHTVNEDNEPIIHTIDERENNPSNSTRTFKRPSQDPEVSATEKWMKSLYHATSTQENKKQITLQNIYENDELFFAYKEHSAYSRLQQED